MTSKELFKKWKEWIVIECPCDRNDVDELNQIERDLEALEISKKHMWFSFHKELGFQVFCNDTIDLGNEEEFNLLKERLEDE